MLEWDYEYAASQTRRLPGRDKEKALPGSLLEGRIKLTSEEVRTEASKRMKQVCPEQVTKALTELPEKHQEKYDACLKGRNIGDMFDLPLTWLKRLVATGRGRASEEFWIKKVYNTTKNIKSFKVGQEEGSFNTRRPDVYTATIVADVKDVKKVSFDAQLRDFILLPPVRTP